MLSVIILGSGNIGTHLFKTLNRSKQVAVLQWYNRTKNNSSNTNGVQPNCFNLNELKVADVYIIAISDKAINEVSEALPFDNRLVVHTSGSANISAIDKKNRRGVLYPLQTFSKEINLNFSEIPICIEAADKKDLSILKKIGEYLGCRTHAISSEQRLSLHLAAVFVNNFSNQMYRIAHEITDIKNINFEILRPLIIETARKVSVTTPYHAQTGPAVRKDKSTMKKHLKILEHYPKYKILYEEITKSIQITHGK